MSDDPSTETAKAEKARESTNTPESFEKQQETIAALREQLAQANERDRENRRLGQAGLIFIYTGMGTWAVAVVVASVILVIREIYPERAVTCFSNYSLPILLVVASVIFLGCGYLILRTVRPPPPPRLQEGAENEA